MKELENKKELIEEEVEEVSGGFDWPMIPDFGPNPYDPVNLPDIEADRPLPFPQDRRGNKAPVEAPTKASLEAPNKAGPLFL